MRPEFSAIISQFFFLHNKRNREKQRNQKENCEIEEDPKNKGANYMHFIRKNLVVPIERFELPTHCLQDSSSTPELNRQKKEALILVKNKKIARSFV